MNDKAPRTVFITGATSGIGLALAHEYANRGDQVVAVGRRPRGEVEPVLPQDAIYCRADLSESSACEAVSRATVDASIESIDILIHNAAVGFYGHPADQSADSVQQLVQTNLMAPVELTRSCLPLLSKPRSKVVFISSVVSRSACPDYAVYAATKAAIDGFARCLRIELRGEIDVQVIHPGGIDSQHFPSAEKVAAKIVRAIDKRRRSATIGFRNSLLRTMQYHFGGVIERIQRRRRGS